MKEIIAIALITALLLACCIEELPGEFEEYESEYFSIDIPEDWVKHRYEFSPGEAVFEFYPSEHGRHSKNPDIELRIFNSSARNLDEFLAGQGINSYNMRDCRIAGTTGKKVTRTDSEYEYITFYFPMKTERYGFDVRHYYCRLMFRRELSTFDDAAWNNFVERIAGSLELDD